MNPSDIMKYFSKILVEQLAAWIEHYNPSDLGKNTCISWNQKNIPRFIYIIS